MPMSPDCMSGKHDSKIWPWHPQRPKVIKQVATCFQKKCFGIAICSENRGPHCTQRSLAFVWSCHGPARFIHPMWRHEMDTIIKKWVHIYRYLYCIITWPLLDFIGISVNHSTLWSDGFVWLLGRHHHTLFITLRRRFCHIIYIDIT